MDATQKRRMWKVAIAYFAITAFVLTVCYFTAFPTSPRNWNTWQKFDNTYIWNAYLNNLSLKIIFILQPFFWFGMFLKSDLGFWLPLSLLPIWSICLGWIFVKLDDWLNHFPVLGRKVF